MSENWRKKNRMLLLNLAFVLILISFIIGYIGGVRNIEGLITLSLILNIVVICLIILIKR